MTDRSTYGTFDRPVHVSRHTRYEDHPWRDTREAQEWTRALGCTLDELPDELLRLWKRIDATASEVWRLHSSIEDVPDDTIPRAVSEGAARLSNALLAVEAVMRRAGAHIG